MIAKAAACAVAVTVTVPLVGCAVALACWDEIRQRLEALPLTPTERATFIARMDEVNHLRGY